ncbi:hypothetical protein [uncultured Pseudomonas sp.]|uniref:hypothetical protein n=1 Tax=uncultured Pseudomonas sp. TaxID=114707 RepID=UPI0025E77A0B|nr:hypothetical protein [uncultured Pseudomonas sp.]
MSFGALFTGDQGQTIIDDTNSLCHVMASGIIDSSGSVTYPTPIATSQPPLVWVNLDGAGYLTYFQHTGSAGNWTGFSFQWNTYDLTSISRSGRYIATGTFPPARPGWGLRVLDASSRVLADTGYKFFRFYGGTQAWSYVGSGRVGQNYYYHFNANWPSTGFYFLASHFMRGIYRTVVNGVTAYNSCLLSIGHRSADKSQVFASLETISQTQPNSLQFPLIYGA